MKERTVSGLNVVLTGGSDREGGGDGPLVVLMHGFGAPGTDLVSLWRQLDVPPPVRFAFPQAPLDLSEELGGAVPPGARAWWMIDVQALEEATRGGQRPDRSDEVPEGLAQARAQMIRALDELEASLGVPAGQLFLGGFSQGSMLALDIALRTDRPLAGLVLMSTTLIAAGEWEPRMPSRRGLPVLQSHGRADPLLPFAAAERVRDLLRQAGLDVRWIEFNGGHTIGDSVVDGIARFITELVG